MSTLAQSALLTLNKAVKNCIHSVFFYTCICIVPADGIFTVKLEQPYMMKN